MSTLEQPRLGKLGQLGHWSPRVEDTPSESGYSLAGMANKADPLAPDKLQLFVASLAGLAPAEITKAKILYIRNAIDEYEAQLISARASKWLFLMFAIVPLFWPFLYVGKKSMDTQFEVGRRRILNAVDVWADELRGQHLELERLVPLKWF